MYECIDILTEFRAGGGAFFGLFSVSVTKLEKKTNINIDKKIILILLKRTV